MSYCICCNSSLLRHVRHGEVYMYCPECRQEMPEAESLTTTVNLSPSLLDQVLFKSLRLANA